MSDYQIGKDVGVIKSVIENLTLDLQRLIKEINTIKVRLNVLEKKK